jgi:hypothetical protein
MLPSAQVPMCVCVCVFWGGGVRGGGHWLAMCVCGFACMHVCVCVCVCCFLDTWARGSMQSVSAMSPPPPPPPPPRLPPSAQRCATTPTCSTIPTRVCTSGWVRQRRWPSECSPKRWGRSLLLTPAPAPHHHCTTTAPPLPATCAQPCMSCALPARCMPALSPPPHPHLRTQIH